MVKKQNIVNVVCERPPGGLKMIKNHLGSNFVKSSKVPYSTDEKLEVQNFFLLQSPMKPSVIIIGV